METINTRIRGIPAIVRYEWQPYDPGTREIAPTLGGYIFDICDRRGRPAPWLECTMSEADWDAVMAEVDWP